MAKKGAKKGAKAKLAMTSAATGPAPTPPVIVRISSAGVVLDQVAHVTNGQDVKWVAQDGGGPWTIKFDKGGSAGATYPVAPNINPFSVNTNDTFLVPRAGERETNLGPVKGNVNTTYRYTVYDENGIPKDDPDVDVE